MSPRFQPRLYVLRLVWLGRQAALRGAGALCACPGAMGGRSCLADRAWAARTRRSRPFPRRVRP